MKKIFKWVGIVFGLLIVLGVIGSIFGGSEQAITEADSSTLYLVGENNKLFDSKDFKPVDNKNQAFEQGDVLKYNNIVVMVQDSMLVPKDMIVDQYPEAASEKENIPVLDVKFELVNLGQENLSLVPDVFELLNNGEAYSGALIHPKTPTTDIKKGETRLVRAAFKAPTYEDTTKPYEVLVCLETPDEKLFSIKFNVRPNK